MEVSKNDKLLTSGTQKESVNIWALDGHKKVSLPCIILNRSVVGFRSPAAKGMCRSRNGKGGRLLACGRLEPGFVKLELSTGERIVRHLGCYSTIPVIFTIP